MGKYIWIWKCPKCGTVLKTDSSEVPYCKPCDMAYNFLHQRENP